MDTPRQTRIRNAKNILLAKMLELREDDGERLAFQVHGARFVQATIFDPSIRNPNEFYALTHEGSGTERLSIVHCFARNKDALQHFEEHVKTLDPDATLDYRGKTNELADIIGLTRPAATIGERVAHPVLTLAQAETAFMAYRELPEALRKNMAEKNKDRMLGMMQRLLYEVNAHLPPGKDGAALATPSYG